MLQDLVGVLLLSDILTLMIRCQSHQDILAQREDLEAVLDRLGCWEITIVEVIAPNKDDYY